MVGNDIVDLCDRDADMASYRDGFDARVFTEAECAEIAKASLPNPTRWRLWAAKEASYKLARQRDPETIFSPRNFEVCEGGHVGRATVNHEGDHFVVVFDETPKRIHAIAVGSEAELATIVSGVDTVDAGESEFESAAVRALACDSIARHFGMPRESLEIRKSGRVPYLFRDSEPAKLAISLSHHGSFIAFACGEGETRVA